MVAAGRRATAQAQKWKYGSEDLPKGAKNAGVPHRNVWLLYIWSRGAGVITVANPCYLPSNRLNTPCYEV